MAWQVTIDEQDTLVNGAVQDAPFDLATTFRLADGVSQTAQGLLDPNDADLYSIGMLFAGSYLFSGTLASWFDGAGYAGAGVPYLRLYNSSGTAVTN